MDRCGDGVPSIPYSVRAEIERLARKSEGFPPGAPIARRRWAEAEAMLAPWAKHYMITCRSRVVRIEDECGPSQEDTRWTDSVCVTSHDTCTV